MSPGLIWQICLLFGGASLLSIGGGNSVVPEIQLRAVSGYHWLTDNQFADLFAIAQTAPGPSILLVTLVGYAAAGVAGALLATLAMVLPAAVVVYGCSRMWHAAEQAKWRIAFERGLAPVAVGLVAASGLIVAGSADHTEAQFALTAAATAVFCLSRVNPLLVVGAAALLGILGVV
jgi:chromate transporter